MSPRPWDTASVRQPHWLAAEAREALAAALRGALDAGPLHPVVAVQLEDVLTELQVASARDRVWPEPAALVRQATGLPDDVVPVRLSAAEVTSVLTLPGLPDGVRGSLSPGAGVR